MADINHIISYYCDISLNLKYSGVKSKNVYDIFINELIGWNSVTCHINKALKLYFLGQDILKENLFTTVIYILQQDFGYQFSTQVILVFSAF